MLSNDNMNTEMTINNFGMTNPTNTMPSAISPQTAAPVKPFQMVYPEIYYKLQPYIMMVCDQVDPYGFMMPTQDMIERITDNIYDDMCKMYPDLAEYAHSKDDRGNADPVVETARFGRDPDQFSWRFRRRGLFRDLIDILLFSELFRRRRRY